MKWLELFKELTGVSMSDYTTHEIVEKICERDDIFDVALSTDEIKEKVKEIGEGKNRER